MSKQITIWTTKTKESNVDYKFLKNVIIILRTIHYFTHFSHEYHGEKWLLGVKNAIFSTTNCGFISQQLVIMYRMWNSYRGFSWRWLVGICLALVGVSRFNTCFITMPKRPVKERGDFRQCGVATLPYKHRKRHTEEEGPSNPSNVDESFAATHSAYRLWRTARVGRSICWCSFFCVLFHIVFQIQNIYDSSNPSIFLSCRNCQIYCGKRSLGKSVASLTLNNSFEFELCTDQC